MPNDSGRPAPIADALRRFLQQQGLAARVDQASVLEAWPSVVGPGVAAVTEPVSVGGDGTLFVAVKSSAWMAELAMMEREIVAAINRRSERYRVERIRWQLSR